MNKKVYLRYDNIKYNKLLKKNKIKKWIKKIFRELKLKKSYCSIFFTNLETMKMLNDQYFNKKSPTDVIAFSQIEGKKCDFMNSNFIGDIAICVPYAKEQSMERNHSLYLEILYLILHGILHLLGYDHKEYEKGEMIDLQNKIFFKLTGENFG